MNLDAFWNGFEKRAKEEVDPLLFWERESIRAQKEEPKKARPGAVMDAISWAQDYAPDVGFGPYGG